MQLQEGGTTGIVPTATTTSSSTLIMEKENTNCAAEKSNIKKNKRQKTTVRPASGKATPTGIDNSSNNTSAVPPLKLPTRPRTTPNRSRTKGSQSARYHYSSSSSSSNNNTRGHRHRGGGRGRGGRNLKSAGAVSSTASLSARSAASRGGAIYMTPLEQMSYKYVLLSFSLVFGCYFIFFLFFLSSFLLMHHPGTLHYVRARERKKSPASLDSSSGSLRLFPSPPSFYSFYSPLCARMDEADKYMRKIQRQKREISVSERKMKESKESIQKVAKKLAFYMNDTSKR